MTHRLTNLQPDELPDDPDIAGRVRLVELSESGATTVLPWTVRLERFWKIAAIFGSMGVAMGVLFTSLGWRAVGPPADIAILRETQVRADSIVNARIARVEADVNEIRTRQVATENDARLVFYMVCTMTRRSDPNAVPPECNSPRGTR